jgi:hypothetical protein
MDDGTGHGVAGGMERTEVSDEEMIMAEGANSGEEAELESN